MTDNIQSKGAGLQNALLTRIRIAVMPGFAIMAALLCSGQGVSSPELKPELVRQINRLADLQRDLTKMNTLGAELQIVESARTTTSQGNVVGYELFAKNLPRDRQYVLSTERINQEVTKEDKMKTLD